MSYSEIETILARGLLVTIPAIPAISDIFVGGRKEYGKAIFALILVLVFAPAIVFTEGAAKFALALSLGIIALIYGAVTRDQMPTMSLTLGLVAAAVDASITSDNRYYNQDQVTEEFGKIRSDGTTNWNMLTVGVSVVFAFLSVAGPFIGDAVVSRGRGLIRDTEYAIGDEVSGVRIELLGEPGTGKSDVIERFVKRKRVISTPRNVYEGPRYEVRR